jgi:hypothetical protein
VQQTSSHADPAQPSMSLDEALAVRWTPRGYCRPIRELLAARAITESDLTWAAIQADRIHPRIREAALTILAHKRLPPSSQRANPGERPRVIGGSKYLRQNERKNFADVILISVLAAAYALWIIFMIVQEWIRGTLTIPILVVAGLLLLFAIRIASRRRRRAYGDYRKFKKGREGEEYIVQRAMTILDGNWTIFRNFVMPGRTGDIDIVLAGPGGVWVFEVKNWNAKTGLTFGRGWNHKRVAASNPRSQAMSNAHCLKELLDRRRCEVPWVQAVLVFVGEGRDHFAASSDALRVWGKESVVFHLTQLRSTTRLSQPHVDRIVAELEGIQASAKRR